MQRRMREGNQLLFVPPAERGRHLSPPQAFKEIQYSHLSKASVMDSKSLAYYVTKVFAMVLRWQGKRSTLLEALLLLVGYSFLVLKLQ